MTQVAFRINQDRCMGCRACVVACKAENNTRKGVSYRTVVNRKIGSGTSSRLRHTSIACNHCDNPACMAACPVKPIKAILKSSTTGIVSIDQDKCVGCRRCEWACPYGAAQWNSNSKKVEKCTFCEHRFYTGSLYGNTPTDSRTACAQTCPGKALNSYGNKTAAIPPETILSGDNLPDDGLTNPNTFMITEGTEA